MYKYENTLERSKLFQFCLTVTMILTFVLGIYLSSLVARFLRLSYRGHRWCLRPVTLLLTLFLASPIALLLALFGVLPIDTAMAVSGLGYLFGEPKYSPWMIMWAAAFWWLMGKHLEILFTDWAFLRTLVVWSRWNGDDLVQSSINAAEQDDEWRARCWQQANLAAHVYSCLGLIGTPFAGRWIFFTHDGEHRPTAFFRSHFLETAPAH